MFRVANPDPKPNPNINPVTGQLSALAKGKAKATPEQLKAQEDADALLLKKQKIADAQSAKTIGPQPPTPTFHPVAKPVAKPAAIPAAIPVAKPVAKPVTKSAAQAAPQFTRPASPSGPRAPAAGVTKPETRPPSPAGSEDSTPKPVAQPAAQKPPAAGVSQPAAQETPAVAVAQRVRPPSPVGPRPQSPTKPVAQP